MFKLKFDISPKSLILILSIFLFGCSERWDGFVYPNKNDLSNHIAIGTFESIESCRESATRTLNSISSTQRGDYECGLNCKTQSLQTDLKICDETSK